jgi:Fe-S-cluster containining protein
MDDPFYSRGLRFACARCSSCCRGAPGFVFLSKSDLARLLNELHLDFPRFFREYCTLVDSGIGLSLSLAEKENYDCVFWTERGCSIYGFRPVQCSTYPFWSSILDSPEEWKTESEHCPGIGTGELRSRNYIESRLCERRLAGTIILEYGTNPESIDADTILGC